MKRFQFCLAKGLFDSPELGRYISFGICVYELQQGVAVQVDCIPDISTNERIVSALAHRCTELQLEPCHLLDVVLDTIP